MPYADDIDRRDHRIGWYLAFDGIAARLSTHAFDEAAYGALAGTYYPAIVEDSISLSGTSLDRAQSVVQPGGFSCRVAHTSEVLSLLRKRGGTETTLSTSISRTTTTIVLASGTNTYANGATIYLDQETITLGTGVAGTYTGCTRGVSTSLAIEHRAGSIISDVPRYWLGRRAQLIAVNLHIADLAVSTLATQPTPTTQAVRTGMLSSSPRYEDGAWDLQFVDVTRELNRPLYSGGWEAQDVLDITYTATTFTVTVGDARHFSTVADGHVRFSRDGLVEVYKLDNANVNRGANTITFNAVDRIHPSSYRLGRDSALDSVEGLTVQQIGFIPATDPVDAALTVMTSRYGDSVNGSYDVLPGIAPDVAAGTDDVVARRIGAGLLSTWIDTAVWEALRGQALAGAMVTIIDEPMSLFDWLAREVTWKLGGYLFVTQAGLISFRRYLPAVADSTVATFTRADLGDTQVSVVDDESATLGRATLECDWDPEARVYTKKIELVWTDVAELYRDAVTSMSVQSRSTWTSDAFGDALHSVPMGVTDIVALYDRLYSRTRDGIRRIRLVLSWADHVQFIPGFVFNLTDTRVPDGAGANGVTARRYEVTSATPTANGRVEVEAEEMPTGYLVSPAAHVSTILGNTITFDTVGVEADLFDSLPGRDFAAGWSVRLYDFTAVPPYSVSEVEVVSAVGDNTLTLVALPGAFTLGLGDLVTLEFSADITDNTTGADPRDHLHQQASGGTTSTVWS